LEEMEIEIGREFKPSPQLKKLYYIYLMLAVLIGILPWFVPILIFAPITLAMVITVPILIVLIFVIYWIPKYYDSVFYSLNENEITWRRGVWFKKTGIVPYNRITNIDTVQGPISRLLGIASLRIQTAGYSASSSSGIGLAEIRIDGVRQFEELREMIMEFVRGKRPVAVETYEEDVTLRILEELVKIREILEGKESEDT